MKNLTHFLPKFIALFLLMFAGNGFLAAQNCTILGDTIACENEVVAYSTNDSGYVYQWNAFNGTVSGTGSSISVNWNIPGTGLLTLAVKDANNQVVCTESVQIHIQENPAPAISPSFTTSCSNAIGEDHADGEKEGQSSCRSVCDSMWITYSTANHAGSTYDWTVTGNATVIPSTTHEIKVMWTDTGTGLVEVIETDSSGCTGYDELCVDILPRPQANINSMPADSGGVIYVCKGQDVLFINNSDPGAGSPLWSYTWEFGDGNSEVLDALTSNGNVTHSYSSAGTYEVMLITENECHCKDTAYVSVVVDSLPGPEIECVSTVCPGNTVTYATDPGCASYNWTATNGTIVNNSPAHEVTVAWNGTAPAYLSLSTPGCAGSCSTPTTIEVPVIPSTATIEGPELVCQYRCATYSINCNIPVDSIAWHFPDGVNVQTDTINKHSVEVCFYDATFTGGQIMVEYFHETPGSTNDLSCGGTAFLDIEVKPKLYVNYPGEICDSTQLTGSYTNSPTGNLEWTITDANGSTTYATITQPADSAFEPFWTYGPGTFKVTAKDLSDNYCDSAQSFMLTVNELPQPPDSIAGPAPVCPDVPYQYYAFSTAANYSVEWEFENGNPGQNTGQSASVIWTDTLPNVITVTQVNPVTGCKSESYSDTISTLLPLSASLITGNDTVCANGQQAYSTPSPGDDFVWTISPPEAGSVASGQHSENVVVEWHDYNGPAILTLERTACNESIATDYPVEVIAPPVPNITVPATACEGTQVTMSASAPGATFSWDFGDGSTATGSSVNHVFNSPGNKTVIVEASYSGFCTSTATATASIMINPKADITISTPDPNVFCGTPSMVNMFVASPVTGNAYNWYESGSPSALASGTSFSSNSIGEYFVVGSNSFGCIDTSNTIAIDTACTDGCRPEAGSFVSFTRTRLSCNTDSFAGNYSSNAFNPVYTFDDPYSATNSAIGPNATHTFTEPGFYRVKLCVNVPDDTGADTCTICDMQVDTVNYVPDFIDSVYCTNGSDSLAVKLINNTKVLSTAPPPSYEWTINSGPVVSTAENPTIHLLPGSHVVTLIVNGSCEISKTIVIDDLPDATILAADSVCVDAPLQLSSTTSGPILSYNWDFGDGAESLVANPVKTYDMSGNYQVSLHLTNSYGCVDSSAKSITVLPNTLSTAVTALSDTIFCEGDTVGLQSQVSNGYPDYNFLWSTVETSADITAQYTGQYYLEVTDEKGCYSRSNTTNVLANPTPKPRISGKDVACLYEQGTYAVNYPSESYTIEWSLNGDVIFWQTESIYNYYANTTGTDTLTVKVMSANSCIGTDTITIEVVPNPGVSIQSSGNLCESQSNQLVGVTNSPSISNQYWNNGTVNDTLYTTISGKYTYTVEDSLGCTASASVDVHPLPDFCGLLTGCYEICDTINQLVWHAPKGYASYQWLYNGSPIAGSTYDTLQVPLYQSGNYQVAIKTAYGCTDTSDIIDIQFVPCTTCEVNVTDSIYCGPVDENGYQTYTVEFTIDNSFSAGALLSIFSLQGNVTNLSASTVPLGTSTVTATFTDLSPTDTTACFSITLSDNSERCVTKICSALPDCSTNCDFSIYSNCAHCKKETADGWLYSIELSVFNPFSSNASLSVLPISGGTFGAVSPNPIPPGISTVTIPFTDATPSDSIICFRVVMEFMGRECVQDVCVYLPDCSVTGIYDPQDASTFWVYPNPARQRVTVKGDFKRDNVLSIITLNGRKVFTTSLKTNEKVLDIGWLPAGTYFIKLIQDGSSTQQLLIKQ